MTEVTLTFYDKDGKCHEFRGEFEETDAANLVTDFVNTAETFDQWIDGQAL